MTFAELMRRIRMLDDGQLCFFLGYLAGLETDAGVLRAALAATEQYLGDSGAEGTRRPGGCP